MMVLKLKEYPIIILTHAKVQKQRDRRSVFLRQERHLSQVVPYQKKPSVLEQKIEEIVSWYDKFTGMDEVREAQRKVLVEEEKFRSAQEERRNVLIQLKDIQNRMKELFAELEHTNRGDDRYIVLVTQEHKLMKEEKVILEKFAMAEKNERTAFATLSSSVKLSHEKERAQSERTKYWSIIGSIMGTVIGILGTSINNHFKINELKELIKNSYDKQLITNLNNYLENQDKSLVSLVKNNKIKDQNDDKIEELLNKLDSRLCSVEESLKNSQNNNLQVIANSEEACKIIVPVEQLKETVVRENGQIKNLLYALAVLSVIVPLISKYS